MDDSGQSSTLVLPTAYEVVERIVNANPVVESLTLVSYYGGPNWRDLSRAYGNIDLPLSLKGLQQDTGKRILTKLSRNEASAEKLRTIAGSLSEHQLLGVISKAALASGELRHIPMMDFMCEPSPSNQQALTGLLTELQHKSGYLLESGRSYHYYSSQLLDEEQWRVFMGKCLLMSGYVDDRYIGHQLVDGHCVLRVSSGKLKTTLPTVVATFG